MISPDALSDDQKHFLLLNYQLNVDETVRFRRRDRRALIFSAIQPLLALALLWEGIPSSPTFVFKPAEIATWFLAAFFLLGNAIVFAHTWNGITRERPGFQPSNFSWYTLFRDQIGPPSPSFARWMGRVSSLAVVLAAAVAGRPLLAAAWVLAIASYIARDRWEKGVV